jgi:hypothetical protein
MIKYNYEFDTEEDKDREHLVQRDEKQESSDAKKTQDRKKANVSTEQPEEL